MKIALVSASMLAQHKRLDPGYYIGLGTVDVEGLRRAQRRLRAARRAWRVALAQARAKKAHAAALAASGAVQALDSRRT